MNSEAQEPEYSITPKSKQKKLIYKGFYYPYIGIKHSWENKNIKIAWEKKLGEYCGWLSWLPTIGLKCKLDNPQFPYKSEVITAIVQHPEMELKKWHPEDELSIDNFIWVVYTNKGSYIGDIRTAYYRTHLKDFKTYRGDSDVVCVGWDEEQQKACGWSHRAMVCFGKGDKVFQENYGDDYTLFTQHGKKKIRNYSDAMESALNFAHYIA